MPKRKMTDNGQKVLQVTILPLMGCLQNGHSEQCAVFKVDGAIST